jgi:2-keto-3-deoxy-L-rhamnonate aldolase RhmA
MPAAAAAVVAGCAARYGIQQALDLGADGVMVPLVNSRDDAEQVTASTEQAGWRQLLLCLRHHSARAMAELRQHCQ